MDKKFPVITIDGPAGAGKSTMAKYLADALDGFAYLDTGAIYRAISLALIERGFQPDDIGSCRAAITDAAGNAGMSVRFDERGGGGFVQTMCLNGHAVPDDRLRTPGVTAMSSACAVIPDIRLLAGAASRKASEGQALVVDGRDTGTAVFPDAVLKFYLYAPVHDRAVRRMGQDAARGTRRSMDQVLADLRDRDGRDSTRTHDPLKFPPDAIWIDTGMFLEETEKRFLLDIARARLNPSSVRII